MESDSKIPSPPMSPKTNLHKSINFWADVLLRLDKKLQAMEETHAYGDVGVVFKLVHGKIHRVLWTDEISDMELVRKGGGTNSVIAEEEKITTPGK